MDIVLGIDVGGSGIKGALVDTNTGELVSEKVKYKTPQPATVDVIPPVIKQLIDDFDWSGKPIGCGFPAIIKNGVAHSASNIDDSFIGYNLEKNFGDILGCKVYCINDADAAGLASVAFGVGKGIPGTLLFLTLGTGIGSGLFLDGKLLPNTEFGHLKFKKSILEKYAANSIRQKKELSWEQYGKRLNKVLNHIHFVMAPETFIIGGGISKLFHEYEPYLDVKAKIVAAKLQNNAGIIGSACNAKLNHKE